MRFISKVRLTTIGVCLERRRFELPYQSDEAKNTYVTECTRQDVYLSVGAYRTAILINEKHSHTSGKYGIIANYCIAVQIYISNSNLEHVIF